MSSRRDRFRDYMARVNGAVEPSLALERGFYVAPKRDIASRITARLDLQPASTHLVVGGVGSGKTTQLLVTRDRLREQQPDAVAVYVDMSRHQDLDKLKPGALMALVGLMLCDEAGQGSEGIEQLRRSFRKWADGAWVPDFEDDEEYLASQAPYPVAFLPGVLTPPPDTLAKDIREKRDELTRLIAAAFPPGTPIVLLVDSLDRMSALDKLQPLIEQDVAAIASAGIGLVVVGPLRMLYGLERDLVERFDHLYRQPAVDTAQDQAGHGFLFDVLRKRADADILPDESCARLVQLSGGVIRDLLRLAHQAGDEAYIDGADRIQPRHIDRAADAFGRSLMLGLGSDDIDKLRQIRATGRFVQTSEQDLALLITRRVLDYPVESNGLRYAVHPTLEPFLEPLEEAS